MSKILVVPAHTEIISTCGECAHSENYICELTESEIPNYWNGVLADCPLEEKDDE